MAFVADLQLGVVRSRAEQGRYREQYDLTGSVANLGLAVFHCLLGLLAFCSSLVSQ